MKKFFRIILAIVMLSLSALPVLSVKASAIYDYWNVGEDTNQQFFPAQGAAETITPSVNYNLDFVSLLLERVGSPGIITVTLRDSTGFMGAPTSTVLATATLDGNTISNTSYQWTQFEFDSSYTLQANTTYAIVAYSSNASPAYPTNFVKWASDTTDNATDRTRGYPNGGYFYKAGGGSWSYGGGDLMFECYGSSDVPTLTTTNALINVSGNITFSASISDIGESNITSVGFELAGLDEDYFWDWNDTVNYSEPQSFSANISPGYWGTGLVTGITYKYRAFATNSSGTAYGYERTFIYQAIPAVTTGSESQFTSWAGTVYTLSGNITSSGDVTNKVDFRGFEVGLISGVWDTSLRLEDFASTRVGEWDGTIGEYSYSTNRFAVNTTYYYQAFVGKMITGGPGPTLYYGYGEIKSFTTASVAVTDVPVVITNNAFISPIDGSFTMAGTVVTSATAITQRGFRRSLSSNMTGYSYTSDLADSFALGYYSKTIALSGAFLNSGITIYVQAFAVNSAGTGVGNIYAYAVPDYNVGPGGLTITNGIVTINGNTATLKATVLNPGGVVITRYGFIWGLTDPGEDNNWNDVTVDGTVQSISHVITGLNATAVYFFRSGVLLNSGRWYWSTATAFTTGATIPAPAVNGPTVETKTATGIGANYFTANGDLLSKGETIGSIVSSRGFVYSITNSGQLSTWITIAESGDFSTGTFSKQINVSQDNPIIYYAACATNQYVTSYGRVFYVNFSGGGSDNGTSGGGGTGGVIGDFAQWLKNLMASWGMDNLMGHWAFMGIFILIIAILFGGFAVGITDATIRKVIMVIAGLVVFSIFGAFVFSGLLGIWAVAILVIVAVGLIIIVGGRLLQGGTV